MSNSNPDYRAQPGINALADLVARANHDTVWAQLGDLTRRLEDYLNRQVVRRVRSSGEVLGTTTAHTGTTAWQVVAPAVRVTFPKASPSSVFVVDVHVGGYVDALPAPPGWAGFGVRVTDAAGTSYGDVEVCRVPFAAAAVYEHGSGSAEYTALVPAGLVTVDLLVRVNAAGTSWQSASRASMSVTVTEVHAA